MSKVISGITKVFKKITKSPIGQLAVGAVAAYFTAGLGASLLGATGLSSSLSPVLGTVLSYGISGAAAGGLTSLVSGGNIGKGMLLGGAGGAVLGGVMAYTGNTLPGDWKPPSEAAGSSVGAAGDTLAAQVSNPVQDVGTPASQGLIRTSAGTESLTPPPGYPVYPADAPGVAAPLTGAAAGAPPVDLAGVTPSFKPDPPAPGFMDKAGAWINANPGPTAILAGGAVSGVGQGAGAFLSADAEAEAAREKSESEIKTLKDRQAGIAASHTGATGGLLTPVQVAAVQSGQPQRPTPTQRWDPRTYQGTYQYDPSIGRVIFIPNAA